MIIATAAGCTANASFVRNPYFSKYPASCAIYSGQVVPVRVAKLMVTSRSAGVGACATDVPSARRLAASILAHDMRYVLVVLIADVFEQFRVYLEHRVSVHGERPGVRPRIVDDGFEIQMPEVGAPVSFDDVQFFGVRMT